ncbi:hypothetical protein ACXR0O_27270 [Verrucomicrobiota bacterium sgz303538]
MPRKRTTSNNFKPSDTPLDAKQRAIQEQEAKLRAQMEKYQKLIEDAPKLAKERERVRREQFITRAARTEQRYGSRAALPDRRYELNAGLPGKQRRLRAERNRGRNTFFVLLLLLAIAATYLYFTITHP